jgi:hypothetical protein
VAFGAIDLFSGSKSITGSNLWQVDKNPLMQLDEGVEDIVGKQATQVGDFMMTSILNSLDAMLGIPPSKPSSPPTSTTQWTDVVQWVNDFLGFFGLSSVGSTTGGSSSSTPGSVDWNSWSSILAYVENLLWPTNKVAPIVTDPNSSAGVAGFVPIENLAVEILGELIGGAQGVIDAILNSVGIPPGSGTENQVNQYFTDLLNMFGNPNLTNASYSATQSTINFIEQMLAPTNLLAPLEQLFPGVFTVPGQNIPGLDASKITTGVFANSFIPGLEQTWNAGINALLGSGSGLEGFATALQNIPGDNLIGTIAAQLISGTLSALTIPGLDATVITSGQFPQTMISELPSQLNNILGQLSAPFDPSLTPNLSIYALGNFSPNLLVNPTYPDASSVNDPTGNWVWSGVSHTLDGSGSVMVTADATDLVLPVGAIIPVSPGQSLTCSHWLTWSDVTGTGLCFTLSLDTFTGGAAVGNVALQSVNNPAPSSAGWVELSGGYAVPPSGVDGVQLVLEVTAACVSGTVHWDDGSVQKTQLMAQSWMAGLTGDINNLYSGLSVTAAQTDMISLVNTLGLGSYSTVGAALAGITQRLTGINIAGLLDASWLTNILNIPLLPASAIPPIDATKVVTGTLSASTMPVVTVSTTNAAGHTVIPDVQTIFNGLVNSWSGLNSDLNFLMAEANVAMTSMFGNIITNSVTGQNNSQLSAGLSNSGVAQTVNFANYADNTLGSPPTATPPGPGFVITYGLGPDAGSVGTPGSSSLNITGGLAHWNVVPDGNRIALAMYPTPTLTGFQRLGATVGSGPTMSGGVSGANYIIARANGSGAPGTAIPTDYVYAKFYAVGLLSYAADLGCVVGGVRHVWVTGIPMPINANNWLQCGTAANPRQFQIISGTNPVYTYTDAAAQSAYDTSHQFWGFGGLVASNGNAFPGDGAGVSAADDQPPTTKGSHASMYRANSSTPVALPGGGSGVTQPVQLPTNFFDSPGGNISPDFAAGPNLNLAAGTFTATYEGTYMINARVRFSSSVSAVIYLGLFVNNSLHKYGAQAPDNNAYIVQGAWSVYLRAGDTVSIATFSTGLTVNILTGAANGAETYFDISLANLSLN